MFASQANGVARQLKQSLLHIEVTTIWTVYVDVHLRFAATDDRVLDITMLPQDFGQCMEVCMFLCYIFWRFEPEFHFLKFFLIYI